MHQFGGRHGSNWDTGSVERERKVVLASGADVFDFAWSDARQDLPDRSDERSEIPHAVGTHPHHDDAERKCAKLVLAFKPAVHREERSDCPAARRSSSPFWTPAQPNS